jgi:FAD/FMN-containing dehydrogenase
VEFNFAKVFAFKHHVSAVVFKIRNILSEDRKSVKMEAGCFPKRQKLFTSGIETSAAPSRASEVEYSANFYFISNLNCLLTNSTEIA